MIYSMIVNNAKKIVALTIAFAIMAVCLVAEPAHARLKASSGTNLNSYFNFSIDTTVSDSIVDNIDPDSIVGFTGGPQEARDFVFWSVTSDDLVGKYVGAIQEARLRAYAGSTPYADISFNNADLLVYKLNGGLRYKATAVDTNSKYEPVDFYFDILSSDSNLIKSLLDSLPSFETLSDSSIIYIRDDVVAGRSLPAKLLSYEGFDPRPVQSSRRSSLSFTFVSAPQADVPESGSPVSLLGLGALGAVWLLKRPQRWKKRFNRRRDRPRKQ